MDNVSRIIINVATKHFGEFKVRGEEVVAEYCPFCKGGTNGDRETFAINLETGGYNCKRGACNAKGGIRDLLNYFDEDYPNSLPTPNTIGKKKKVYDRPDESILHPITEDIITYFFSRAISEETLKDFKISSDENGNIIFPFYRNGELIYVKYRKPKKHTKDDGPKEWQMKNTESILFGMDLVSFNKPLIITEGEIDTLSLYEAGCRNVVSVPCGCDNMSWLDTSKEWLDKFPQIIIFGDSDEPGLRMINNLVEEIGKDKCMIPPEYPELILDGKDMNRICKDANEILYAYGAEGLRHVVSQCEEAPVEGILNLADVAFFDPTTVPRIFTRIPKLDDMIGGLGEGSMTVLSGKRGEGKSTISGSFLLNAIQQGYNCAAYSGELPAYKFLEWIMLQATESKYIGIKVDERSGKRFPIVSPQIQKRIKEWINNKFYLFDNTIVQTMSEPDAVLESFKICARRYGCKIFLVDNLMSVLRSPDEENKAQARFAAALKAFAVKYRVAVLLVAHPRKTKAGEKFTSEDVAGSSAITNLADTVLNIEKPSIRVTKNRDFGDCGLIDCSYDPVNRRIFETNTGDKTVYGWNHEGIVEPDEPARNRAGFEIQVGIPNGASAYPA